MNSVFFSCLLLLAIFCTYVSSYPLLPTSSLDATDVVFAGSQNTSVSFVKRNAQKKKQKYVVKLSFIIDSTPKEKEKEEKKLAEEFIVDVNKIMRKSGLRGDMIQFKLNEIKFESEPILNEGGNVTLAFESWKIEYANNYKPSNHVGVRLTRARGDEVIGIAYVKGVCTDWGSAMVSGYQPSLKNGLYKTTFIHELLHSLGVNHDEKDECSNSIMAPYNSGSKKISSCSSDALKDLMPEHTCLKLVDDPDADPNAEEDPDDDNEEDALPEDIDKYTGGTEALKEGPSGKRRVFHFEGAAGRWDSKEQTWLDLYKSIPVTPVPEQEETSQGEASEPTVEKGDDTESKSSLSSTTESDLNQEEVLPLDINNDLSLDSDEAQEKKNHNKREAVSSSDTPDDALEADASTDEIVSKADSSKVEQLPDKLTQNDDNLDEVPSVLPKPDKANMDEVASALIVPNEDEEEASQKSEEAKAVGLEATVDDATAEALTDEAKVSEKLKGSKKRKNSKKSQKSKRRKKSNQSKKDEKGDESNDKKQKDELKEGDETEDMDTQETDEMDEDGEDEDMDTMHETDELDEEEEEDVTEKMEDKTNKSEGKQELNQPKETEVKNTEKTEESNEIKETKAETPEEATQSTEAPLIESKKTEAQKMDQVEDFPEIEETEKQDDLLNVKDKKGKKKRESISLEEAFLTPSVESLTSPDSEAEQSMVDAKGTDFVSAEPTITPTEGTEELTPQKDREGKQLLLNSFEEEVAQLNPEVSSTTLTNSVSEPRESVVDDSEEIATETESLTPERPTSSHPLSSIPPPGPSFVNPYDSQMNQALAAGSGSSISTESEMTSPSSPELTDIPSDSSSQDEPISLESAPARHQVASSSSPELQSIPLVDAEPVPVPVSEPLTSASISSKPEAEPQPVENLLLPSSSSIEAPIDTASLVSQVSPSIEAPIDTAPAVPEAASPIQAPMETAPVVSEISAPVQGPIDTAPEVSQAAVSPEPPVSAPPMVVASPDPADAAPSS